MLDWSLVTDDREIVIVVPRAVQREIDRHKDGGNARRAARARKSWSLFAKLIDSGEVRMTTEIKDRRVGLELLMPKIRAEDYPDLDFADPDDLIVAEALWVQQQHASDHVTFVSNDTPAIMTAKSHNLHYQRPPEQWMLPPEKDERDKTIEELRKQIKALNEQSPYLVFETINISATPGAFELTLFPELDYSEVSILMDEIKLRFPMQTDFSEQPPTRPGNVGLGYAPMIQRLVSDRRWEPVGEQRIKRYQERDYPEWLEKIESGLRVMHAKLNVGLRKSIQVSLENKGQQPARNLLVTYSADGPIIFATPERESDKDESSGDDFLLTPPPSAPTGRYVSRLDQFGGIAHNAIASAVPFPHDFSSLLQNPRHDSNAFYWKPHRPKDESQVWALECDEFRHQHEPFSLDLVFRPEPLSEGEISASLRCSAHASNIPKQIELILPVRIRVLRGNTMDRVREELQRLL